MNIDQVRNDTPACKQVIHFNNAGASLPPQCVTDATLDYLQEESQQGGYETAVTREREINGFYTASAKLLNCNPDNMAFCFNATDAYTRALSSIPFQPDDVILTTDDDYIANQIAFISLRERLGIKIERSRNLENGDLDLDHFESQLNRHHPKLVAVTHVPTNSGLIQDVETVGDLCASRDCFYLIDACQSAGQLALDVNTLKCDFLSATGRKFLRGPRGTGLLYVSDRALENKVLPLFPDQVGVEWHEADQYRIHSRARRFEIWEKSYANMVGLAEAINYANKTGLPAIESRNGRLVQKLTKELSEISGIRMLDKGTHRASIVTFQPDLSKEEVARRLTKGRVNFGIAGTENALIDFNKKGVSWAVRLSPHYYNTEDEIEAVIALLR